jgi:hypothetical protein
MRNKKKLPITEGIARFTSQIKKEPQLTTRATLSVTKSGEINVFNKKIRMALFVMPNSMMLKVGKKLKIRNKVLITSMLSSIPSSNPKILNARKY